jgi:DNA repair photolyase
LLVRFSIEADRMCPPGLPPRANPVERRFAAAASLIAACVRVVITVSPLLPITDPGRLFELIEH